MKRLTIPILIALIVSACGAEPAPTVNPVDIQNTAVSAAFTVVAETQAAIPTATPLPPTETPSPTPVPTDTPISLPTLELPTFTAVPASSSGGDHCSTRILSWSPKGKNTTILLVNTTSAPITVSVYLNETPDHFECGYRSYSIKARDRVTITDLVYYACYSLWAFTPDPSARPQVNASGYGCINNPDKWTFEISEKNIRFSGP